MKNKKTHVSRSSANLQNKQVKASDPGRLLAVIGIAFSFTLLFSLIGFLVSICAIEISRRAGFKNTLAIIGAIVSAACMFLAAVLSFYGILG